jgi:hypothetical protein
VEDFSPRSNRRCGRGGASGGLVLFLFFLLFFFLPMWNRFPRPF